MKCLCGNKDMDCVGSDSYDDWAESYYQCPSCGRVSCHDCDGISWLDDPESECGSWCYDRRDISLKKIKGTKNKWTPKMKTVGEMIDYIDPEDR